MLEASTFKLYDVNCQGLVAACDVAPLKLLTLLAERFGAVLALKVAVFPKAGAGECGGGQQLRLS